MQLVHENFNPSGIEIKMYLGKITEALAYIWNYSKYSRAILVLRYDRKWKYDSMLFLIKISMIRI